MTETVAPGTTRPVSIRGLPAGLVGQIGVRVENDSDQVVVARTTAGLVEYAAGNYRIEITFPDERGYYYVIADHEGVEASEQYNVTFNLPEVSEADLSWTPTVAQVAAYVRARTKARGSGGKELGTFTDQTRPTAEECMALIPDGVQAVRDIGAPCDDELKASATSLAALYCAIIVESSYYPETTGNGQSSAAILERLYNGRVKSYKSARSEADCSGGEEEGGGGGPLPAGSFDDGREIIGPTFPGTGRSGTRAPGSEAPYPWGPAGW